MDWQPISTAPRVADVYDGSWFIALVDGEVIPARWYHDAPTPWAVWGDEDAIKPTHWMPLPSPPRDGDFATLRQADISGISAVSIGSSDGIL